MQGSYDFTIDLTPPETSSSSLDGNPQGAAADTFARLREAVEDQLGLKLEPQRIAVENLVVDKVARLSEN